MYLSKGRAILGAPALITRVGMVRLQYYTVQFWAAVEKAYTCRYEAYDYIVPTRCSQDYELHDIVL